jgi:predicted ArsR family transcriptional regulator
MTVTHYTRNSRRVCETLNLLRESPDLTNVMVGERLGIAPPSAADIMRYLVNDGLVRCTSVPTHNRGRTHFFALSERGLVESNREVPVLRRETKKLLQREFTRKALLDTLRKHGQLTTGALAQAAGFGCSTLRGYIPEMLELGQVEARRYGSAVVYSLGA